MASINGITVKNIKWITDHEGMSIWKCDIYKGSKKLGHAEQDYYSGSADFSFDESILDEEVRSFTASDYVPKMFKDIANAECFISEVVKLTEDEKTWQKGKKYGYNTYVKGKFNNTVYEGYYTNHKGESEVLASQEFADWKNEMKKKHGKYGEPEIVTTVYSDSSQFIVNLP